MHARFAEPEPASPDGVNVIVRVNVETRITQFKKNPNNMADLNEFIDEVVQHAETEANKRRGETQKSQQNKEKRPSFAIPEIKNAKVVNRARGFVVRIFDAICNCANNNAAAATTRFKMRSNGAGSNIVSGSGNGSGSGRVHISIGGNKRQQSQDGSAGGGAGKRQQSQDEPETLALSKKKPAAEGKKKSKGVTIAEDVEAGVRLVE